MAPFGIMAIVFRVGNFTLALPLISIKNVHARDSESDNSITPCFDRREFSVRTSFVGTRNSLVLFHRRDKRARFAFGHYTFHDGQWFRFASTLSNIVCRSDSDLLPGGFCVFSNARQQAARRTPRHARTRPEGPRRLSERRCGCSDEVLRRHRGSRRQAEYAPSRRDRPKSRRSG